MGRTRNYLLQVFVAVLAVGLAIGLWLVIAPFIGHETPYLTLYLAVVLAALFGGWQAGVLATVLSVAVAGYVFIPPFEQWNIRNEADALALVFFAAASLLICLLAALLSRSQRVQAASRLEKMEALRRSEQAVRLGEERLRLAQQAAKVGTFEWDIPRNRIWAPDLEALYGLPPGGFGGTYKDWAALVHPDDLAETECRVWDAMDSGDYSAEFRTVWPDGTVRWLTARGQVFKDEDGNPLQMVGINMDITERKQADEALRRSAQFPEENPSPVLRVSVDGALLYANSAAREWLETLGWQDGQPLPPPLIELVDRGRAQDPESEGEIDTPSGRTLWMFASQPPGEQYVNLYGRDITERKRGEQALRESQENLTRLVDNLARSNRELQQFAYVASHDLQEPLRQVIAFTQLLESRHKDLLDKPAAEYLAFIIEGAKRMNSLILDLLAYARLDSGREPEPVALQDALDQALHNLGLAIEENHATITHDELPTVYADKSQLVQVFQNLIGNAIKFRADADPVIHVGAERQGNEWLFSVRDNGIGFDPEYADKLFQIFQRLHSRRTYGGTGIGLTICKRVIEQHGGRIWAKSQPGKGSTFYFTIPATDELET